MYGFDYGRFQLQLAIMDWAIQQVYYLFLTHVLRIPSVFRFILYCYLFKKISCFFCQICQYCSLYSLVKKDDIISCCTCSFAKLNFLQQFCNTFSGISSNLPRALKLIKRIFFFLPLSISAREKTIGIMYLPNTLTIKSRHHMPAFFIKVLFLLL